MQKLDPELNHPPDRSREIKWEELLVFLEEEIPSSKKRLLQNLKIDGLKDTKW